MCIVYFAPTLFVPDGKNKKKWHCTWVTASWCRISVIWESPTMSKCAATDWQTRTPAGENPPHPMTILPRFHGDAARGGSAGTRRFPSNEANWIILSIYLCTQQSLLQRPRAFYHPRNAERGFGWRGGCRLGLQLVVFTLCRAERLNCLSVLWCETRPRQMWKRLPPPTC